MGKAQAEASDLRTEEKAKNQATIGDSQAGQKAVGAALAVLKEFYAKAAGATAFVQTQAAGIKMGSDEWNALANPNFKGEVDMATRRACRPSARSSLDSRMLQEVS